MSDDPTQPDAPAAASPETPPAEPTRPRSVSVPTWLAAALVVLLGLAIGAAGFALGRVTDSGHGGHPPAVFGRGPLNGRRGGFGTFGPGRLGIGPGGGTGTPLTPPSTAA